MISNYFNYTSWFCSFILTRTKNPWSLTLILNRTTLNIQPICKVMFLGFLNPLYIMVQLTAHVSLSRFPVLATL